MQHVTENDIPLFSKIYFAWPWGNSWTSNLLRECSQEKPLEKLKEIRLARKQEAFCNLISEATSHHMCYVLYFIRCALFYSFKVSCQAQSTWKERGLIQGVNTCRWDHQVFWRLFQPSKLKVVRHCNRWLLSGKGRGMVWKSRQD